MTTSEKDERPLRQRGLATLGSMLFAKLDHSGQRVFRNEQDKQTILFLAKKQQELQIQRDNEKLQKNVNAK